MTRIAAVLVGILAVSCAAEPSFPGRVRRTARLLMAGDRYMRRHVYNRAWECYASALKEDVGVYNVHLRLARVWTRLGEREKAAYHLRYALFFFPDDVRGYLAGAELFRGPDSARARRYLVRAEEISGKKLRVGIPVPAPPAARDIPGRDVHAEARSLARAARAGDYAGALRAASGLSAGGQAAVVAKAVEMLSRGGELNAAVELAEMFVRHGGDPSLLLRAGNTCYARGRFAPALACYLRYQAACPGDAVGYLNAAVVYFRVGFPGRAEAMLERAGEGAAAAAAEIRKRYEDGRALVPVGEDRRNAVPGKGDAHEDRDTDRE